MASSSTTEVEQGGESGSGKRLSVILITKNEQAHIRACLESVSFADEIIVVDSGSSDDTVEIARSMGAKVTVLPGLARIRAAKKPCPGSGDGRLGVVH